MSLASLASPSGATGFPAPYRDPWRIAAVVLAFIAWWPLGLALLLLWKGFVFVGCITRWMDRGERRLPAVIRTGSGNTAFDEYRDGVLRRLEEERRKLEEDRRAFGDFLDQLKRAKDREEFDRFMAGRTQQGRTS